MTKQAQQLLAAALTLPEEERATLVVDLLASIRPDAQRSAAQLDESRARLAAHQSGLNVAISNDDAMRLVSE